MRPAAEQPGERFLEFERLRERIPAFGFGKARQQIHIALRIIIAARDGAEEAHIGRAVAGGKREDGVAMFGDEFAFGHAPTLPQISCSAQPRSFLTVMNAEDQRVPNRLAGCTLGAWSALLLYFYFSGRIQSFLAPAFRPYVLCAGVVMALVAVVLLIAGGSLHECGDDCAPLAGGFHVGKQTVCFLMIAPLLVAVFAGEDSFSAATVANRTEITNPAELRRAPTVPAPAFAEAPLPSKEPLPEPTLFSDPPAEPDSYLIRTPEGYIKVEVFDLLFAVQEEGLRKDFEGKTVQLVAQYLPSKSEQLRVHRFKAVRMFMMCCAADARPVSALIEADSLPKVPEMSWLKITGIATFPTLNGKRTPVVKATSVEKIAKPGEAMLF